jgi:hypothetical protein
LPAPFRGALVLLDRDGPLRRRSGTARGATGVDMTRERHDDRGRRRTAPGSRAGRSRSRSRPSLPRLCTLACVAALSACEAPGTPHLATLVSPTGAYEVRLYGRVTSAALLEHRVRAEVYRNGAPYIPPRVIYFAGLFNTSFEDRFGPPDWIVSNVLRFPAAGGAGGREPDVLHVRNLDAQPFQSIRIETSTEMFMVFDVAPGTDLVLPMTPPAKAADATWFDVLGEPGGAAAMMRGHGTFEPPDGPRAALAFTVDVSRHGVVVGGGNRRATP